MSFAKFFVLVLSFTIGANALATPHVVRHAAHHHAIAARIASPEPLDVPVLPVKKRQNSRRCRQRSSAALAPTSSSSTRVANPTTTTTKDRSTPTPPPPQPTTTQAPPPPPSTTSKPPPTTTKASNPNPGNLPSFMIGTQTGQGTFYATGLGACGITNTDTDHIAAVSHLLFDAFPGYAGGNPNQNPICGRSVTATYKGKSTTVQITDRCQACKITDLDFSPSAFADLADFSIGRLDDVTWVWN